jgi:hypothetical protein
MQRSLWPLGLGIVLVVAGILSLGNYLWVRAQATRTPVMTLAELSQKGPGPDGYVILTDLQIASDGAAFWQEKRSEKKIEWYVPVFSSSSGEPNPDEISYVMCVHDIDRRDEIARKRANFEIVCSLEKDASKVPEWAKQDLSGRYYGLRWGSVQILRTGQREPTANSANDSLWYVAMLPLGIVILLFWSAKSPQPQKR